MPSGALLRWGSWIYLALAPAAVLWLGLRDGAIPLALFFDRGAWLADLASGGLAAAAIVGLWHLGLLAVPGGRALERTIQDTIGPLTTSEVLTLAVVSGFAEELFFRGAVQSHWGIVPTTILFALLHAGPGREFRLWTVFALFAGTVLGTLMIWRGNLLAPAVAHAAVNLFGLARLQRRTIESPREAP